MDPDDALLALASGRPRTTSLYAWEGLKEDVEAMEPFLRKIVRTGDVLRKDLEQRLDILGVKGELLEVGSTSPERLTAATDPKAPAEYLCDFDMVLLVENGKSDEELENVLESLLPEGKRSQYVIRREEPDSPYRIRARKSYAGAFPVSLSIVREREAEINEPVEYSRNHAFFDGEQTFHIRALKLFMMRAGAYGGFTRGIKGMAVEQAIARYGDFDGAVKGLLKGTYPLLLDSEKSGGSGGAERELKLPNPIDGRNIIPRAQQDVLLRVAEESLEYCRSGLVRSEPFGMRYWQETHPGNFSVMLRSGAAEPRRVFEQSKEILNQSVRKVLKKSGGYPDPDALNPCVLVVPYCTSIEAFMSVGVPEEPELRDGLGRELRRRWNAPGSPGAAVKN